MRYAPMPGWFWPTLIISGGLSLFLWLKQENDKVG